jgi:hypothetical protein
MLVRWTAAWIMILVGKLCGHMQSEFDSHRVAGYVIFGADGSRAYPRKKHAQSAGKPRLIRELRTCTVT